jgi:hypothetical protein
LLGGSTFKFTSNGDSIWTRFDTVFVHPDCGSDNYLGGVAVLPSGSVIAAGYANSYCFPLVRSYAWLLKISKDGCIETLCNSTDIQTPGASEASVKVFPNPASGDVVFTLKSDELVGRELTLNISDLNGKQVWSQSLTGHDAGMLTVWNTAQVPAGVYVYRLVSKDGSFTRQGKIVIQK